MAKKNISKTNAMRILDSKKVDYAMREYSVEDGLIDGVSVAHKIDMPVDRVYKTLVTHGSEDIYVFVIPVDHELDLKKAAKTAGEKKVEMVAVSDIENLTGYIRGGCSPIGMKKNYKTFIHHDAEDKETIIVSGGRIGTQIEISPNKLADIVRGRFSDI